MNIKTGLSILALVALIITLQLFSSSYLKQAQHLDTQAVTSDPGLNSAEAKVGEPTDRAMAPSQHQVTTPNPTQHTMTDLATKESLTRLRMGQTEEALLELDPLLENYEELGSDEKFTLVNGYANYYLAQGDLATVVELYEAALEMQTLPSEERLLLNRTLGQLSLHLNRIDQGVAYFDDYFAEGGEIDSAVSLTLARTHGRVGDSAETIRYLGLHLQLISEEGRELDSAMYARSYSLFEEQLLHAEDQSMAILIAADLARTFDRAEPWKNLAELYALNGQTTSYNEVLQLAENRGYYAEGKWLLEEDR